jgi:hypothetical protein
LEATSSTPSASNSVHWNSERGATWLKELLEKQSLSPCRALVLGAAMEEEALILARRGFHTIVVDPDSSALGKLRSQAKNLGVEIDTIHGDPFVLRPSFFGPVEFVYDRTLFHHLEPVERAAWGHLISRILPNGGSFAGLFLVGRGAEGPPHPVVLEDLRHLLRRHFVEEGMETLETAVPGKNQVTGGLYRHK